MENYGGGGQDYPSQSLKSSITKTLYVNNQLTSSVKEPNPCTNLHKKQRRHQKNANKMKISIDRITKNSSAKIYNYPIDNQSPGASFEERVLRKHSSNNLLTGLISIQGNGIGNSKFKN